MKNKIASENNPIEMMNSKNYTAYLNLSVFGGTLSL